MLRDKGMVREELRVGICDDSEENLDLTEEALRKALRKNNIPVRLLCRKFSDCESLYEASGKEEFHIFFLEIIMPGMDGFGLAEKLCMTRPQARLVFVSVHESLVFGAFRYMPLWFVRKGRLEQDMYQAVRMYFQVTASMRISYHLVKGTSGSRELLIRDILYIECSGHNLTIQLVNGDKLEKYGSLKSMEDELTGCHFLRTHKNYLVNQQYIKGVGKREIYLVDGSTLEMGRDRRVAVQKAMLQYERECQGD